jgi:Flp pilus assembly protein TadD
MKDRIIGPRDIIARFEKALELNPRDAHAHSHLGDILTLVGRLDEAIAHCRTALEINPDDFEAHGHLAMALARAGRRDEAIPHLEKAVAADPDSPTVQLTRMYLEPR